MRSLSVFIITTFFALACNNQSSETTSSIALADLQGDWVLTHEVFNSKTINCKEDLIKTVLSLKENGYYMMYDDLSESGISDNLAKIQTLYQGQYVLQSDTLNIYYTVDDTDKDDIYRVVKNTEEQLVLENTRTKRKMHYERK